MIYRNNQILRKSKAFALRIIKLYKYLQEEKNEYVMSKQILRCGTSIGANVYESVFAQSTPDFLSKLSIALKESGETEYWLDLLYESDYLPNDAYNSISKDCSEILKLLISITKTTKEKIITNY